MALLITYWYLLVVRKQCIWQLGGQPAAAIAWTLFVREIALCISSQNAIHIEPAASNNAPAAMGPTVTIRPAIEHHSSIS